MAEQKETGKLEAGKKFRVTKSMLLAAFAFAVLVYCLYLMTQPADAAVGAAQSGPPGGGNILGGLMRLRIGG